MAGHQNVRGTEIFSRRSSEKNFGRRKVDCRDGYSLGPAEDSGQRDHAVMEDYYYDEQGEIKNEEGLSD